MTEPCNNLQADVVFAGGGISALVAALELVQEGKSVLILERNGAERLGGQAKDSFGGFLFVDSPEQRRAKVKDSLELAWEDWRGYAEFGPGSALAQAWARRYLERGLADVREPLLKLGLSFFPLPAWAERAYRGRGNRVPRFHLLWGCGAGLVERLLERLKPFEGKRFRIACRHQVQGLLAEAGRVVGFHGTAEGRPFEARGAQNVVCGGGFNGNLERVRERWPSAWGKAPAELLNGSYPWIDGSLQDFSVALGASTGPLENMWIYAAGIEHWNGDFPGHGLAVVPPRSALWLDAEGARFSPPLLAGTDTHDLVARISARSRPWSWLLLNRRILAKEAAIQGSAFNPAFRQHSWGRLLANIAFGNTAQADELLTQSADVVSAPELGALVTRMNQRSAEACVDPDAVRAAVCAWDAELARGPAFATDEQLQYLRSVRANRGDRLRTCAFQPILEPKAGPLVAIRLRLLSRKSLAGLVTALDGQVHTTVGEPLPGLYALGEAAGFGGGGMNGRRALEGTLLGGCVLGARQFAAVTLTGRLPGE
jgi:predicted oxidoreductase